MSATTTTSSHITADDIVTAGRAATLPCASEFIDQGPVLIPLIWAG